MNILLLLFPLLFSVLQASQLIIECKFPCIQSDQICQVTSTSIQCSPLTNDTRWILKNAMSLPEYQGTLAGLGETCTKAPQPYLGNSSYLSVNSSETLIDWPLRGYDAYYGNCAPGLYCDRANVCVKKLLQGSVCDSDNQCLYGVCNQKTCQGNPVSNTGPVFTTVHIVITIIGILLFFGVLFGIYLFRRRRNQKRKMTNELLENKPSDPNKLQTSACHSNSSSSSDTRNTHTRASSTTTVHSNHHVVTNILHPDYDSHFSHQSVPELPVQQSQQLLHPNCTPSMRQQQLQYQLQRQLLDKKESTSLPPPPYSP